MKKILSPLLLVAAVSICHAQSKENPLLEEAKKAIAASNAIYSDLALKNDGSILTRYTDDACLFPPNSPPLCGSEQILKFFKDGPPVSAIFKIVNVYGDGKEYVTEETLYELFDPTGKKVDNGKILVLWKKTKDGWKMHRDMFSSNREL
ncbi:MAG TPA: nuclear transport factor 2 family protein [Cyclobacteriaceae bacterium]